MSDNANEMLGKVAVASLQKCVEKLTKVSAGVWSIAGADVSIGSLDEAMKHRSSEEGEASAVYCEVKGEQPFITMILFDPRDIDRISKCFLGYSFSISTVLSQAEELLLSELGNIILNSFISALSNILKRTFIPSAPKCLRGSQQYLLETIGAALDVRQRYHVINLKLDIQCDNSVTRSGILALIPEKLAQELLSVQKAVSSDTAQAPAFKTEE